MKRKPMTDKEATAIVAGVVVRLLRERRIHKTVRSWPAHEQDCKTLRDAFDRLAVQLERKVLPRARVTANDVMTVTQTAFVFVEELDATDPLVSGPDGDTATGDQGPGVRLHADDGPEG